MDMPDLTSIVFVVDDDVSVRESLELLIKSAGWRAETFESGQDFLSRPRTCVPCCLLLDVSLPGLSGLELQQQLTKRTDMSYTSRSSQLHVVQSGTALGIDSPSAICVFTRIRSLRANE